RGASGAFFVSLCIGGNVTGRQGRQFFARRLRYFFRRQGKTLGGRVTSNAPPSFRMRSWWTVPLLAPRAVWRRPLSVDKCPSLMTYAGGSSNAPNQAASAALVSWS